MCFKKLARTVVGAGVGFLTGGPLGAVAGGAAALAVKGKSIIGGAALGLAGGVGSGLIGAAGGLGKVVPALGQAALSSAKTSFGQPKGQAGAGAAAGLLASPTPVGAPTPVSGFAEGGIMAAPVSMDTDEDSVNLGIKMAMNINDSFNRALG